eukprot:gene23575-9100_t
MSRQFSASPASAPQAIASTRRIPSLTSTITPALLSTPTHPSLPTPASCLHRSLNPLDRRQTTVGQRSVSTSATSPGYYYRDHAPWPTATEIPLVTHDLDATPYVDLIVCGSGPAGVAAAERVAAAGFSVCVVDPNPLSAWPNNYGVWVDEFEAMGLRDCLEVIWPSAKDGRKIQGTLVLDATGHSRKLVEYDQKFNPGFQGAYGIVAEVGPGWQRGSRVVPGGTWHRG